jgi:hypothetical protein
MCEWGPSDLVPKEAVGIFEDQERLLLTHCYNIKYTTDEQLQVPVLE